jgi:hypothetical protein
VEERAKRRAAFVGYDRNTPWDRLSPAHFLGYAMWNYLTLPFLFTWPGFSNQELEPHVEGKETWRVLEVAYPDGFSIQMRVMLSCSNTRMTFPRKF